MALHIQIEGGQQTKNVRPVTKEDGLDAKSVDKTEQH